MTDFRIKKRNEILSKMEENSMMILHSNYSAFLTCDEFYPFKVNNNFYYLTGLEEENIILVLAKLGERNIVKLFIDENDPVKVKWVGAKYYPEEASKISGIEIKDIMFNDSFSSFINDMVQPNRYSENMVQTIYLDLEVRKVPLYNTFALDYAKVLQRDYPSVKILNAYPVIIETRMIKDDFEIELMKQSISTTNRAILNVMKHARELNNESEALAYHQFVLISEDKRNSFDSIIASGKNAVTLHYSSNNSPIEKDGLLLMDVGSATHTYASDITRTFPVSGKFTPRQKDIYNAVLDVNKACIVYARKGLSWRELNEYANDMLAQKLIDLGVTKEKTELRKYYFHSIGHSLGLDTHDPDIRSKGLLPGMVITIEPGLYIPEEGIGIRIEDDILITEGESIVLSKEIIKEVDEIEAFMAN